MNRDPRIKKIKKRASDWDVMQILSRLREHEDLLQFFSDPSVWGGRASDWDVMQGPEKDKALKPFEHLEPATRDALKKMKRKVLKAFAELQGDQMKWKTEF